MTLKMRASLTTLLISAAMLSPAAWADGLSSLEKFASQVKNGQASFSQTVTPPEKAGKPSRPKTQTGHFAFERPGKFRFDYQQPFAQTIVADGNTLWLYDADLNQVTSKSQKAALGDTPAALISSSANLNALRQDFTLTALPFADEQDWVLATPKRSDGQIKSIRVGLKTNAENTPPHLHTLDITDNFGQRSVITFSGFQANTALPASSFQFTPPAGADVLKD